MQTRTLDVIFLLSLFLIPVFITFQLYFRMIPILDGIFFLFFFTVSLSSRQFKQQYLSLMDYYKSSLKEHPLGLQHKDWMDGHGNPLIKYAEKNLTS